MAAAAGPRALRVVALVSFGESALLPLPVDAVTLPVMLADRRRVWPVAWLATWTSVLGGAVGYALGLLLYETLVRWLIGFYGWEQAFAAFQADFHARGALIVAIGALTPVPYKLIAIASGVEGLDFGLFLAISLLGRGARFAAFAALVWWCGPAVRRLLDRHARWVGWAVLALLLLGFVLVGWLA